MIILGIETSTVICSAGLANESGQLAERSLVESHIHSEKLLTLARDVCLDQRVELSQLDGIAISIGPGSFTGLRIGLSTAKGLCYALEKPLIAIPTFEAVASEVFKAQPDCTRAVIVIDAKQGEYYIGAYEKKNGELCEVVPVQIGGVSSAIAAATEGTVLVTNRIDEMKKMSGNSRAVQDVLPYCRADTVAEIAIAKLKAGTKNDLEHLEPLYLKDFVVLMHRKSAI